MNPHRMDMILRLRQKGISDLNMLRAMERLPREQFARETDMALAYGEGERPLDFGQTMLGPFTTAVLAQALNVTPSDRVLLIGVGSGYLAAVLAQCCDQIFALDRYKGFCDRAVQLLDSCGIHNSAIIHGDGLLGYEKAANFDRIIAAGRVEEWPEAWENQLSKDGVIVAGFGEHIVQRTYAQNGWENRDIIAKRLPLLKPGKSQVL